MKKQDVRVGSSYLAKVSGEGVPVKITGEKWAGDKHVGWAAVNTKTGRPVRIKSTQRLRADVPTRPKAGDGAAGGPKAGIPAKPATPAPGATSGDKAAKSGKDAADPKPPGRGAKGGGKPEPKTKSKGTKGRRSGRLSALDAAAKVLAESDKPMRVGEVVQAIEAKGLWKSKAGKTPAATVAAAIIREIAAKGKDSRFKKVDRGLFTVTAHAAKAG